MTDVLVGGPAAAAPTLVLAHGAGAPRAAAHGERPEPP